MAYEIRDMNTNEVLATETRIGKAQSALMTALATGHAALIWMSLGGKSLIMQKLSSIS